MRKILAKGIKLTPLALLGYAYCADKPTYEQISFSGLKDFKGFKSRQ